MTIISVVSGKGGTGKTLISAVLAELLGKAGFLVLVIDLDIHVRGMTSLLYTSEEVGAHATKQETLAVADFFANATRGLQKRMHERKISQYRSFAVLPAVRSVASKLKFVDKTVYDRRAARLILHRILQQFATDYQITILDCRAGFDAMTAAVYAASDITVAVEEDDVIARVSAENLVSQLKAIPSKSKLFRLTNKARRILADSDVDHSVRRVGHLGSIPFDMDVMNAYGETRFWDEISRTLFRFALVKAWNRLCQKLRLPYALGGTRFSAVSSNALEARIGQLSTRERVYFVYGVVTLLVSLFIYFLGSGRIASLSVTDIAALLTGIAGVAGILYSVLVVGSRR